MHFFLNSRGQAFIKKNLFERKAIAMPKNHNGGFMNNKDDKIHDSLSLMHTGI